MLFFLPAELRRKYAPPVRILIGVLLIALGLAWLGRIPLVVGGLVLVWGIFSLIAYRRGGDDR
jgi:fatty acid desaturase